MQAVQVTLDVKQWLSALHDLTTRAAAFENDREVLLGIDPLKKTLTLFEEGPDSQYRITLPLSGRPSGEAAYGMVAVSKLESMHNLFGTQRGDMTLIARRTTLSFKCGKKHLLLPNRLLSPPPEGQIDFFTKKISGWEQVTRFAIPDFRTLVQSIAEGHNPVLKARVEKGSVAIGDLSFPAATRDASPECLLPRVPLARRMQQVPAEATLEGAIGHHRGLYLRTTEAQTVREMFILPLPVTTLFISKRKSVKQVEQEPNLFWTQTAREQAAPKTENTEGTEASEKRPPILRAEDLMPGETAAPERRTPANRDLFDEEPVEPNSPSEYEPSAPSADTIDPDTPDAPPAIDPADTPSPARHPKPVSAKKASPLERLEQWPGLLQVKKQLRDISHFAVFEKERMEVLGLPQKTPTLHMAFLGNPGTGKTMVARMIGRLFREMGLLSKGHVVEVDRSALVGAYMGHTEANLTKYVKRALGGVLFVDEAYALFKKDSSKDFGMTAINGLVKAMEDHKEQLVVIFAGYKQEMREFFTANPGLRERVPFHIDFPDYTEEELLQIADYLAAKDHYTLTPNAKEALLKRVLREKLDETFGNGRTVRNLMEKAIIRHAVRAANSDPSQETYTTLTAEDFQVEDLPETETLEDVLAELDRLVGLEEVKRLVRQMVDVLALEKKRLAHGLQDSPLTLHMAFTGNPGTGKTTVARLMGRLLRAMELLPKGHFVEASRKDLVAGYMGQTTLKTAEKLKEALGGVLFIDEAYALGTRGQKDFGAEALATMIKEMEDRKGLLTVILAGYTKEMGELFRLNPGLKSRVRFTLHFPDYTASDLVEIVKRKAQASQYRLTEEAEEKLWQLFIRECSQAGEEFGNGRLAEQVFEKAKLRLSTRVGRLEGDVEKEMLMTITEEDVEF